MAVLALLHPAQQIGWTNWTVHPSTVVGVAALGALYVWRARRIQRRAPSAERAAVHPALGARRCDPSRLAPSGLQHFALFAGLFVLFASLNGTIHDLSDYYLFSAHMVQHLLLSLIVPPLLVGGLTGEMLRPLLRHRVVFRVAHRLTRGPLAFVLFNVVMAVWPLPEV